MELTETKIKDLKQKYETPPELFEWVVKQVRQFGIYSFALDAAASQHNRKCYCYIAKEHVEGVDEERVGGCRGYDGLQADWWSACTTDIGIEDAYPWQCAVWCNPPFGMTKLFLPKAYEEARKGVFSVLLTQTDTSVLWWQEAMKHATARIDIHPRVNFIQHPRYMEYHKTKCTTPSSNTGGNSLWIFNPYDIDRPAGARIVPCEPWR